MRFLAAEELPRLSTQVKSLVRDGIYTLYEVHGVGASYLVFTQARTEHYFLSASGEVVWLGVEPEQFRIVDAVSFTANGDSLDVRINCASA